MNRPLNVPLTPGRLGAAVGVSADTIRYYEKRGLLPAPTRTAGGYRSYPAAAAHRVRMIQAALAAGFTLAELAEILKERDAGGTPCSRVVELASAKLKALEERIAQLNTLRSSLASLVDQWARKLSETPPGARADLLTELAEQGITPLTNERKSLMKKSAFASLITVIVLTALLSVPKRAQGQARPADEHSASVDMRGDHAMGFSHETTEHHFRLLNDGGVIEVDVRNAADAATRDKIRMHLNHIASMFRANDFDIPMFIHDQIPPGVPVMKQRHDSISYTYSQTDLGAEVRITTHDASALEGVHDFLRFQIQDHRTGDPLTVREE